MKKAIKTYSYIDLPPFLSFFFSNKKEKNLYQLYKPLLLLYFSCLFFKIHSFFSISNTHNNTLSNTHTHKKKRFRFFLKINQKKIKTYFLKKKLESVRIIHIKK